MGLLAYLKEKILGKSKAVKEKYVIGLAKSRSQFSERLGALSRRYRETNESYFQELEDILIEADLGVKLTDDILLATRAESQSQGITDPAHINEILIDKMFIGYAQSGADVKTEITFHPERPTIALIVGVNGVGKTTTIAKLTHRYQTKGKQVLLVSGDTFRAGAQEQLGIWAARLGADIVTGRPGEDPSAVTYRGMEQAQKGAYDLVIIDTAGRLQTKTHLMAELTKVRRTIARFYENAPDEVLLIIDATTGQNGVFQAQAFAEATGLTGVIITKMDGTSKGGIVLSIRDQLGVPVRFIGFGEKLTDLDEFDLDSYLYGLCLGDE
ncbi:MAG: signal recognition particle-docking protein FtsY [Bacilli bacterium]|jgi:fused signal recognition particle receptor